MNAPDLDFPAMLEAVVARTGHTRFRALCDESNPRHLEFRRSVAMIYRGELEAERPAIRAEELAGLVGHGHPAELEGDQGGTVEHTAAPAGEYPTAAAMVASAVRAAGEFFGSGCVLVTAEAFESRLAICGECDQFDQAYGRCQICGCFMRVKAWANVFRCPIGKW